MRKKSNPSIATSLRLVARLMGVVVAVVGFVVLVGWQFHVQSMMTLIPDQLPMEPNSALAFLLAGLAVVALTRHRHSWFRLILGRACALAVFLLAVATLWEYATGMNLGIDTMLVKHSTETVGISWAGRMAPNAAVNFSLLGLALLVLDWRVPGCLQPSQLLAVGAFSASAVTVLSWTYALSSLHKIGSLFQMPLETAITCGILGGAVFFARPEAGIAEIFTSDFYGGVTARRLIPFLFGYPLVVAWMRVLLEEAGLPETPQLRAVLFLLVFAPMPLLVWWVCQSLDASDAAHSAVEEQVRELNESLKHQVEQLAVARDQAMEASRLKSQFVANISHELRTPLGGVIGMSELLLESDLNPEQRKYATMALESGRSLLAVINELLDFSSLDSGKIKLTALRFSPAEVVRECVELMRGEARQKNLTLRLVCEDDLPGQVEGDPLRLRAVFLNLIGNAIKFTESGGIVVRCAIESKEESTVRVRFSVSDSGIGIPEFQRDKLFEPFVQADGSTTRRKGGTGLGLSICKRIVELMGGVMGLDSIEGSGSTFWFIVPFKRSLTSVSATQT